MPSTKLNGSRDDRDSKLLGKVAVVTGASSGFGKGAARELARHGAAVVIAARREELLRELEAELISFGCEALAVPTDVSIESEVKNLCDQAVARFGQIDIWINNAGAGAIGPFLDIPMEDHVQVIATDLMGTLYGSFHAYRQFVSQGAGTLINISSELGKTSVPYYTSYTAAKHGVVGLSTSLRQEIMQNDTLKEHVHVCVVMPTAHDTPFFDHVANYTGHEIAAPPPLHSPDEVVDAIVALAINPKDEKIVGSDGYLKFFQNSGMPDTAEKISAKMMHKVQMEKAPAGPDSRGAVQSPIGKGREVSGGRK
jgi:short-subunit dehydrogenase